MGIVADIYEESQERFNATGLYDLYFLYPSMDNPYPIPIEKSECPLCGQIFITTDGIKEHIKDAHGNQQAYLCINNIIVRDYIRLEEPIFSFEAVLLNFEKSYYTLKINGEIVEQSKEFSKKVSLNQQFKNLIDGEIELYIELPHQTKEFTVYYRKKPEFESTSIDEHAFKCLFLTLNNKEKPNFDEFCRETIYKSRNRLEKRYAEGLLDYALAFCLINEGQKAKEHFENALGSLLLFKTIFAITAQRLLALRMNCFDLLQNSPNESIFSLAKQFFSSQEDSTITNRYTTFYEQRIGVYIDEFTEKFLKALGAYYKKDFVILDDLCKELDNLARKEENQNNTNKLLLLQARSAKRKGCLSESRDFYRLINDPFFQKEVREALDDTWNEKQ